MKRSHDGESALGEGRDLFARDGHAGHVRELVNPAGKRQFNALPFNGVGSDESPVSVRSRDDRPHLIDAQHRKRTSSHFGEEGDLITAAPFATSALTFAVASWTDLTGAAIPGCRPVGYPPGTVITGPAETSRG